MESSAEVVSDKKINGSENEDVNSSVKADPKLGTGAAEDPVHGYMTRRKEDAPCFLNSSGDVNMEATITSEDVMRAGGFGARDDIGNVLPVASDATDFEETLIDARDYEEPQAEGETRRPGLGWTEADSWTAWYASESVEAACDWAYKGVEEDSVLEDEYFLSRLPTVYLRLAQGAIRLAATLNRVFE